MPEQDNDRLEDFFQKAASKPDVTFNEEDWKKLEARLDATDGGFIEAKKPGGRITTAIVIGTLFFFSTVVWLNSRYDLVSFAAPQSATGSSEKVNGNVEAPPVTNESPVMENQAPDKSSGESDGTIADLRTKADSKKRIHPSITLNEENEESITKELTVEPEGNISTDDKNTRTASMDTVEESNFVSSAVEERNKQKAVVELPGAEEGETREAEAIINEEHASDKEEHVSMPRLSLLLSFAPDFSSTTISDYTAPGKAFGAMVHYHLWNRWTVSAGVIKNHKTYTGAGEDYQPPRGYWKYYTNGVIPETIDGSCSILEFPVMIQYTIVQNGKNKWVAGAGASSYTMLSESYRYNFGAPNPGAKSGWDSKQSSRSIFNMLNLTMGYERRVLPGLMIGLEPYVKLPLEEIGWSNLKLFSTGASVTLRYQILAKQNKSVQVQSRGPD
jgi:hypothetical protein